MKPISISIKGLNSFVEEQTIDFEKLSSQGLFGIFGPTGSGKSTVLDAITFALYGQIARESNKKNKSEYINTNLDTARVVFEFEVNSDTSRRYKIIRELKRNKKGSVQTGECKIVSLTENEILGEKERETSEAIKKIIGLEYEDFVKTVVLPQGGFNDFLKMEGKDRREILERLFNLEKYGRDLEIKIGEQVKKVELEKSTIEGELKAYGEISEDLVKEQEQLVNKSKEELQILEKEKKASDQDFERSKAVFELQKNLLELEKGLQQELSNAPQIEGLKRQLDEANKATILEPMFKSYRVLNERGSKAKNELSQLEEHHKEMVQLQKDLSELFQKIDEEKNTRYPELLKKQAALDGSLERWQKHSENKKRLSTIDEELTKSEQKAKQIESKNEQLISQKIELEKDILSKKDWIKQNKVSQEEKNRLTEAVTYFDKRKDLTERFELLSSEVLKAQEKLKQIEQEIADLKMKQTELWEQKNSLCKQQELYKQSPFADPLHLVEKKQKFLQQIEEIGQRSKKQQEYIEISNSLTELLAGRESHQKKMFTAGSEYQKKQQEYQELLMKNSADVIRRSLHEGDLCPVCSNLVKDLREEDLKQDDNTTVLLGQIQIQLEELGKEQQQLVQMKGSMDEKISSLEKTKKELDEELQRPMSEPDKDVLQEQFLKDEQEDQKIRSGLKEYENSLKELEQKEYNLQNLMVAKLATSDAIKEQLTKDLGLSETLHQEIELVSGKLKNVFGDRSDTTPREQLEALNKIQEKIDAIQSEVESSDQKQIERSNEIERLRNDLTELKSVFAGMKAQRQELELIIENDRKQLESLLGSAMDPTTEIEKNKRSIQDLQDRFEKVKRDKDENDRQMNEVSKQKDLAQQNLDSMREMARSSQRELYEKIEMLEIVNFSDLNDQQKFDQLKEWIPKIESKALSDEGKRSKNEQIEQHQRFVSSQKGQIENVKKQIGDHHISEEIFENIKQKNSEINQKFEELLKKLARDQQIYNDKKTKLEQVRELCVRQQKITDRFELLKELRQVFMGKKFVEFMAMKQLDYVTIEATQILSDITNGAYYLEVDEEGAFKIRDNKNGGAIRNVKSLSGGETFVVSLSLALALSAQIQLKGVAPLELFFLDEGFGTLDDDLLEVVMDALEKIQHDRLKIGIISHVEQLKQRIPVKLMVTPAKMGEGGSKVKIEYS